MHETAERAAADWLGAEAALLFPSGYQANVGLLGTLAAAGDTICSDSLAHASLIDAARLSRARIRIHRHGDIGELGRLLATSRSCRRRIVVTEGIFSMSGDAAPLGEIHELCERFDAWLVVDEAHSAGVVGPRGAGAWESVGIAAGEGSRLAARVVTGGKALGVGGAFVVSGTALRDLMVNRARSFIYTTAPPPALAGALAAAIPLAAGMEGERETLRTAARRLAAELGLPEPSGGILPVPLGAPSRALEISARLRAAGLDVRAVRPPTVPEGESGLRVVVHAFNTEAQLGTLTAALRECPGRSARSVGQSRTAADLAEGGAPVRGIAAGNTAPREHAARRGAGARALFVTGTDTGVGKTVTSALLLRAARRMGNTLYWKPVQTGTEDDTAVVARLADAPAGAMAEPSWRLRLPASPHQAAAAEGAQIDLTDLRRRLASISTELPPGARVIVELAGGLLVPYDVERTQADWLAELRPDVVLVARSGLGTLNHTLLSLEALRSRHIEPRALFLVGEPHAANRETLERMSGVALLYEVPPFDPLDTGSLDRWLEVNDLVEVLTP